GYNTAGSYANAFPFTVSSNNNIASLTYTNPISGLGSATGCTVALASNAGSFNADGQYSALFLAPWNSTYYLLAQGGSGVVFSSPDLIQPAHWVSVTSLP